MSNFKYQNQELACDQIPLRELAEAFGTPTFVYSGAAIETAYQRLTTAFQGLNTLICYAVKANANLSVLKRLHELGAGFDIVSGGELARVLRAGADPRKIVFSGVGKQDHEIEAALEAGIHCFNIESEAELDRIASIATTTGHIAPISLRVNPDVDPETHPYISTGLNTAKFGVPMAEAEAFYRKAASLTGIEILGIDCHIGSQITSITPYLAAIDKMFALIDRLMLSGISIKHFDLGGGMGVRYENEPEFPLGALRAALEQRLNDRNLQLVIEPGRYLVANAGVLLTKVIHTKANHEKKFAVVDAAMNDLLRPALYGAVQEVLAVQEPMETGAHTIDVVGPICETGDFLAKDCSIDLKADDLIAICSAGAYGMSMSSNYNTRGRAAEVLVEGGQARLVRTRESVEMQLALEIEHLDKPSTTEH